MTVASSLMTHHLYLEDCYVKQCDTTVRAVSKHDGNILVELAETVFYPGGGGQPHDCGWLIGEQGTVFAVSAVYKFKDKVFHVVDKPGLVAGEKVVCRIDWDRRYRLMRMHTAAHIISDLFEARDNTLVSGNQLGLERSRIDLTLEDFDREHMQSFEDRVHEVVKKNFPIQKYVLSRDEAAQDPGLFTLLKGFPEDIKAIRVVDIVGFDKSACGGTHLDSTGEVKGVRFLKFENRGAKRRRIYFTLVD